MYRSQYLKTSFPRPAKHETYINSNIWAQIFHDYNFSASRPQVATTFFYLPETITNTAKSLLLLLLPAFTISKNYLNNFLLITKKVIITLNSNIFISKNFKRPPPSKKNQAKQRTCKQSRKNQAKYENSYQNQK